MATPMNDKVVGELKTRAAVFGWRMKQLQPFHMTHQECLDLVCPSHYHEILWNAARVADIEGDITDMTITIPHEIDGVSHPKFDLMMRTHEGREPPLRPRGPAWLSCDPAIHNKVIAWATHSLVVNRQAATVKWVVEHLQEICDTGHQIRYLWPAVLHLCAGSANEDVHKWVDKYGQRIAPRSMPKITPQVRKILGDTSEWCAQAVLLSEIPAIQQHEVVISERERYSFELDIDGIEPSTVVLTRDSV
jgi:hypothetical protein